MAGVGDDDLAVRAAIGRVPVEDGPRLRHHWLRREHVRARPAGNRAQLAQRAEVEQRHVGHDLVAVAAKPQDGRLVGHVGDAAQVQILGAAGVDRPQDARRDVRPVGGGGQVAGIAVGAGLFQQQRSEELLLAGGAEGRLVVEAVDDVARAVGVVGAAVADLHAAHEFRVDAAAARAGEVVVAGLAVRALRPAEAVGADGVDQDEGTHQLRVIQRELENGRGPQRPADQMRRPVAQLIRQRLQVVAPIARAARGVDEQVLRVAVAAQVGGDGAEAGRQGQHRFFPESRRRGVAVDEDHRLAVVRPAEEDVAADAGGRDEFGRDSGQGWNSGHSFLLKSKSSRKAR